MDKSKSPARRDSGSVLERILDTPNLEQVVPRLEPGLLHRVIQSCGLERCGELLALATPAQLTRLADFDLWRSHRPGVDEQFDGERFGEWLEVLAELGEDIAAKKLTEMDPELVIAGLAQHMRVLDRVMVTPYRTTDGIEMTSIRNTGPGQECEIGGYRVVAKRTDSWDAIVAILIALDTEHSRHFHKLMHGCRTLSHAGRERDELEDLLAAEDQHMFDLAVERESRRDEQGYVAPPQARAFLEASRTVQLPELFLEAVVTPSRQLPALARRNEKLAYLANTLIAGCSIQGRSFKAQEASDAAVAVCNLGLQNWPPQWTRAQDLVTEFQVGWTVLHRDVGLHTAARLSEILAGLRCNDQEIQMGLNDLRFALAESCRAETPWRARRALEVIAMLDAPAWAALLGLLDECPVLHAAIRGAQNPRTHRVSPTDFEFISENSQIVLVRSFVESLPDRFAA